LCYYYFGKKVFVLSANDAEFAVFSELYGNPLFLDNLDCYPFLLSTSADSYGCGK
jgi:hypothetical protein